MDPATALRLHEAMLLTRVTEERLVKLYRQGRTLGSIYRSLGQEGVACGTALALGPQDVIGPLIRNLGAMLVRGVAPIEVLRQYLGRATGPTGGRELNNHFGDVGRGIIAPTSMLGALVPVMAGVALSFRQRGEARVAMTWIGDGGSSTGAFSEGLNFAVVQRLPLIVVGELNGYAFSTAPERQMKGHLSTRSQGAFTETVDGNDPVAVFQAAERARARCLAGEGPVFLVCETFRLGGHAEHDDQHYVDPGLRAQWAAKDPILRLEAWLEAHGLAPAAGLRARLSTQVAEAAEQALSDPLPQPSQAPPAGRPGPLPHPEGH